MHMIIVWLAKQTRRGDEQIHTQYVRSGADPPLQSHAAPRAVLPLVLGPKMQPKTETDGGCVVRESEWIVRTGWKGLRVRERAIKRVPTSST